MMSYNAVHERMEAILLDMVREGRATFAGASQHGPTFRVNRDDLARRIRASGLLGDTVPWPYVIHASLRLSEANR